MADLTPLPSPHAVKRDHRFLSVGTKLTAAMFVVLGAVTLIAYLEVSRKEREHLLSSKERAGRMVTELFAAGVTAPLSFNDEPGVKEHVALLMGNSSVVYGAVWGAMPGGKRGEKLGESSHMQVAVDPPSATIPTGIRVERTPEAIFVEQPVLGGTGEVLGDVRVAFSLQQENAAIVAAERRTLVTFVATGLVLGGVLLALTRTLIVRRLARLAGAAKRFERGEAADIDVESNDEVGSLARAFSSMTQAIATREERISARNRDMRRVLDNVAEGLLTVKKDGRMSDEHSRVLDDWFGTPTGKLTLWDYFEPVSWTVAHFLRLGWVAIEDAYMPVIVILDQLPRRFEYKKRSFELEYQPIWEGSEDDGVVDEVLVVVRDVTSAVERERAEQAQREAMNVFRRILDDRAGWREFVRGTSQLVDSLASGGTDPARVVMDIHTLKGNAGLYGLETVSGLCHAIESRIHEEGGAPTADDVARVRAAWEHVAKLANELDGAAGHEKVELAIDEFEQHIRELEARGVGEDLIRAVRNWANEPAAHRLQVIAEQGRSVARRLGKGDTVVEASAIPVNLRLPPARWAPIWGVFSHVLRNTFDHGIESPREREAAEKPGYGKVEIAVAASGGFVELRVSDDGRGIAWEKIRERAAEMGLPHATPSDLEEALFTEKVSSRDTATEISGRGVGMGAVRDAVRACGGAIVIETVAGRGTTMRFRFPTSMLETPRRAMRSSAKPKVA